MGDDLRERIALVLRRRGYNVTPEDADAVLAVLREDNPPKVCKTCGSDDPKRYLSRCVGIVDPFHSQGEPCDLCGGTGWVEWDAAEGTPYEGQYRNSSRCPRGCKPEGEKK